jgi:hypothetical protein
VPADESTPVSTLELGVGVEGQFLRQLRRPDLPAEEIEAILHNREARRFHAVRLALARHRNTPRMQALSLVETLFWRDLAHLSADVRVHPEIRRSADSNIRRRLPELAVAERVDLARVAGRGALLMLRQDPDARVVAAFLDNRFATEADVVQAAALSRARPEALAVISGHPRWSVRRTVQQALLSNPALPDDSAEALLDLMTDRELDSLRREPTGREGVRKIAQRILARRLGRV